MFTIVGYTARVAEDRESGFAIEETGRPQLSLMLVIRLAALLFCCATALSAQMLPPGTAIPVVLSSDLNAKRVKPGQKIEGKLAQAIRIPDGGHINKGAHITGHIVSTKSPSGGGSRIVVQFDQLQDEHVSVPLQVGLRAMASSQAVFQAGVPVDVTSDAEPSTEWVTQQVGGDHVFRGRGYMASDNARDGIWDGAGVWGNLPVIEGCAGGENKDPMQALWVFSAAACGIYGFENTRLESDGSNLPPYGQIAIISPKNIDIRGGSGWLLVVNVPEQPKPAK